MLLLKKSKDARRRAGEFILPGTEAQVVAGPPCGVDQEYHRHYHRVMTIANDRAGRTAA